MHGDGSFGLNALEVAVRYNIAILVVVSLNGGWTARPTAQQARAQSWLVYTRFDKIIQQADLESQIKKNGQLVFRRPASGQEQEWGKSASRSSASTY